jgi:PAS domain S-box-containing protein
MALFDVEAGFWALRRELEELVGREATEALLQRAGASGGASFARGFTSPARDVEGALRECLAAYRAAGFGRFELEEIDLPRGRILIRGRNTFEARMARRHPGHSDRPACVYTAGALAGSVNVLLGRRDVVCIERTCAAQGADACLFELSPAETAGKSPPAGLPLPASGRGTDLVEILFHRMPMGIAIIDRDFRIRRYNATWEDFSARYAPPSGAPLAPGVGYFDHLPGTEPIVLPRFQRVLAGETVREEAVRLESDGIVTYWDIVLAPLVEGEEVVGILNVAVDATERIRAERELREREAQYRSIFESTSDAILIFDLEGRIVEANPAACKLYGYSRRELVGLSGAEIVHPDYRHLFRDYLRRVGAGERFTVQSVDLRRDGSPIHVEVRGTPFSYGGKPHLVAVVRDVTERVRARELLEKRVEERTRELSALLEVARAASGSLELPEVLRRVARGLASAVGVRHCGIYLVDEERGCLIPMEGADPGSLPPKAAVGFRSRHLEPSRDPFTREILETKRPVVCGDAEADPRTDKEVVRLLGLKSILGVPFVVKGKVVAVAMLASFDAPHAFTEEQVQLAQGIANTVALAIENARLYARAREAATLEERARLARELHDSVTQSLYSIALFAEAARRLAMAGELETVQEHLGELGEAARQALKEMRLLVYELRQPALARAGLVGALRERLETVERRAGVEVEFSVEGEGKPSPEVEEGLYRIAQEALNNALKHAHADSVRVRLRLAADSVELEIRDDGRGFDPAESTGGLGIPGMRERARALGGEFGISSAPGEGTAVRVRIPLR